MNLFKMLIYGEREREQKNSAARDYPITCSIIL